MWVKTFASQVLREFAQERRRVIAGWRIGIAARRIAHRENAPLPNVKKAAEILEELLSRGDIVPAKGLEGVYVVETPYANLLDVTEEQLIQEAHPWAVFGFLTAMGHHGLTDLIPDRIDAIHFKAGDHLFQAPFGTAADEWAELERPRPKLPRKLGATAVNWTEIQAKWEFGVEVGYSAGQPVYVTDVERTLLDALRMPDKCGGIAQVLRAWKAAEGLDLDRLIAHADRFDIQILRQRVGFVLERLGHSHPTLARWREGLQRGGSVKLVAGEPYAETYSADWNLSLNVPSSVLAIMEGE